MKKSRENKIGNVFDNDDGRFFCEVDMKWRGTQNY